MVRISILSFLGVFLDNVLVISVFLVFFVVSVSSVIFIAVFFCVIFGYFRLVYFFAFQLRLSFFRRFFFGSSQFCLFFFWSFFLVVSVLVCHFCGHFLSLWWKCSCFLVVFCCRFLNNIEKYRKLIEKWKNKVLREKCFFFNLEDCHVVCHFSSFGGNFVILCPFGPII